MLAAAGQDVDGLPEIPVADPNSIPLDEVDLPDPNAHGLIVHRGAQALDLARSRHKNFSRLNDHDCARARRTVLHACGLLLTHAGAVHYTQGPERWDGIHRGLHAAHGQYPLHGDCSSTSAWILWCALHGGPGGFRITDLVNRERWIAGYTGTMLLHGRRIGRPGAVGDQVIYGRPGTTGAHVATYLGGGFVFSHGSEGGPYKLPWNYRSDILRIKRYI